MKKIVSLVLVLSMALSMFSFAFAGTFSDVEGTNYASAVEALVELKVINGFPDGTFKPNQKVTRAEMAKMLVIAMGLESAADLAKGPTRFNDVAADHWASGYINVAAQNGMIVGYPEGDFRPEGEVTYAEAITMAVRALGYRNVVESTGTWPTNYMQKAVELELLEDIENPTGSADAPRGNIAILLWNTLTARMWVIDSENATTGVTYKKSAESMLNIKFPNFRYIEEAIVTDVDVTEDGEVMVELSYSDNGTATKEEAELVKGDFLTLFGQEVSALYDKEEDVFLSVTPTANNKIVAGKIEEVITAGEKIKVNGKEYDVEVTSAYKMTYGSEPVSVFMVLDGKNVEYVTYFGMNTVVMVEKLKAVTDGVRLYNEFSSPTTMTVPEEALVLKDGEWLTAEDIEDGDVVTELLEDKLYSVSTLTVSGTFEEFEQEARKDTGYDYTIVVDGDEYPVSPNARHFIDDEDEGKFVELDKNELEELEDEEVLLTFDYLGIVVRVDTGDISGESGDGDFYVTTSKGFWTVSDSEGETLYIRLMGPNGEEETYTVEEDYDSTKIDEVGINDKGMAVYVEFDDDEIVAIELLTGPYGKDDELTVEKLEPVHDVKNSYIYKTSSTSYKVTSNTVVYKVNRDKDDKFESVEVSEGMDELKGQKGKEVTLVVNTEFDTVEFAFIGDQSSSGLLFGMVERRFKKSGKDAVEIEDAEGDKTSYVVHSESESFNVGDLIAYRLNNKDELKAVEVATTDDPFHASVLIVKEVSSGGRRFKLKVDTTLIPGTFDLDDEEIEIDSTTYDLEDYIFAVVDVVDVDGDLEFDNMRIVDLEDLKLEKGDRLGLGKEEDVIVIYRGLDDLVI